MPPTYAEATLGLEQFGAVLCGTLSTILQPVAIHTVTSRVKAQESADRKLGSASEKYDSYPDLHDLLGIRITTYLSDDVDVVGKLIEREFQVDRARSVDKRRELGPDQFGYVSLHKVARLKSNRSKLPEYEQFKDQYFEIQIRSILQHAWAEIEHDLGYKADDALAPQLRRRFSRLSSLLEIADDEFARLRSDINRYEKSVRKSVAAPETALGLDSTTLTELLDTELLAALDRAVTDALDADLESRIRERYVSRLVLLLRSQGVADVKELRSLVRSHMEDIPPAAGVWYSRRVQPRRPAPRGIGLMMLVNFLVARGLPNSLDAYAVTATSESKESLLARYTEFAEALERKN